MKINLLPGIPDDDNRDYLPEYLKDSEIVVNENGNNSQVYPKRLEEKKGALVDEFVDTWYQYVPESYNPEKKTPVVFSMHGGLMTGWAQAVYTSWTHIADREGFICIFPNAQLRQIPDQSEPASGVNTPRPFLRQAAPVLPGCRCDLRFQ